MGGTPIMALGLVGMPINVLPLEVIGAILRGGQDICRDAWYRLRVATPLSDLQTSGGLLVSCRPDVAAQVLEIFHSQGFAETAVVGKVAAGCGVSVY